jgi:hypothetical protein
MKLGQVNYRFGLPVDTVQLSVRLPWSLRLPLTNLGTKSTHDSIALFYFVGKNSRDFCPRY